MSEPVINVCPSSKQDRDTVINLIGLEVVDRCGVYIAGVCLFHCLVLPFVFLIVPPFSQTFPDLEWLHEPLVISAVLVCVFALARGWKKHERTSLAVLAGTGMGLLIASLVIEGDHALGEAVVSFGAVLVALSHILNIHFCRRCSDGCP